MKFFRLSVFVGIAALSTLCSTGNVRAGDPQLSFGFYNNPTDGTGWQIQRHNAIQGYRWAFGFMLRPDGTGPERQRVTVQPQAFRAMPAMPASRPIVSEPIDPCDPPQLKGVPVSTPQAQPMPARMPQLEHIPAPPVVIQFASDRRR